MSPPRYWQRSVAMNAPTVVKNAFRSVAVCTITPRFPTNNRNLSSLCVACINTLNTVQHSLPMQVKGGVRTNNKVPPIPTGRWISLSRCQFVPESPTAVRGGGNLKRTLKGWGRLDFLKTSPALSLIKAYQRNLISSGSGPVLLIQRHFARCRALAENFSCWNS